MADTSFDLDNRRCNSPHVKESRQMPLGLGILVELLHILWLGIVRPPPTRSNLGQRKAFANPADRRGVRGIGCSGRPDMTMNFDLRQDVVSKVRWGFVGRLKSGSELRSKHCPPACSFLFCCASFKTGSYPPAWRTYLVDKGICDAPDEWRHQRDWFSWGFEWLVNPLVARCHVS